MAGAVLSLVYSTNDHQIQRQSMETSVNQEQAQFSTCGNTEGISEARTLSNNEQKYKFDPDSLCSHCNKDEVYGAGSSLLVLAKKQSPPPSSAADSALLHSENERRKEGEPLGIENLSSCSDTLAICSENFTKANCHVLGLSNPQPASINNPTVPFVTQGKEQILPLNSEQCINEKWYSFKRDPTLADLSLPSSGNDELALQKQNSHVSEDQSISNKKEHIGNPEPSLQYIVVNQGGPLKKINFSAQCLNRKAINNGQHFSKYKQKMFDAMQILEEGILFVSALLQQLGDEFQPLLSSREDSTKWRPPHMSRMDDSFPSGENDLSNKEVDQTVSFAQFCSIQRAANRMSTLEEQKSCRHFDRSRMSEPLKECTWNRRIQITVSSKGLRLSLYVTEKFYSFSYHRCLQALSLYYQCNASSTSGYFFIKVLTEFSCLTFYHSVSLQTAFDPCIHDLCIHDGGDYKTVVDDQGQDNDSDSDSKPNGNSEDEDKHEDQHNSENSGATGGSGSSAGSGDGNDDNNGGGGDDDHHGSNSGNNIHKDDERNDDNYTQEVYSDNDDDEESTTPLTATEHDLCSSLYVTHHSLPVLCDASAVFSFAKTVFTETDLQNIPKLIPFQPCEDIIIIVAPNYGICGTQSCMVTGAIASTQNTDPTTECCSSVPPIREGQPTISGIIPNNPQHISCDHSYQSEVLTSRDEQGTEQFHVVEPVDQILQQNDSVPIHEPIQVYDELSSVGDHENFICDGPFQEEEM